MLTIPQIFPINKARCGAIILFAVFLLLSISVLSIWNESAFADNLRMPSLEPQEISFDYLEDSEEEQAIQTVAGGNALSPTRARTSKTGTETAETPTRLSRNQSPVAIPRQLPKKQTREISGEVSEEISMHEMLLRVENEATQSSNGQGSAKSVPPKAKTRRVPAPDDRPFAPRMIESSDEIDAIYADAGENAANGKNKATGSANADKTPSGNALNGFVPQEGMVYDAATLALLSSGGDVDMNGACVDANGQLVYAPVCPTVCVSIFDNLSIHLGATGFKNQTDLGRNGNFGFMEGFNATYPLTPHATVCGQFGFKALQTDLTGSPERRGSRAQYFITAGVFRRGQCWPIQGGIAYDWYQDNYAGNVKLEQIRTEISWRTASQRYEFGFNGGFGTTKASNSWTRTHFPTAPESNDSYLAAACYYTVFARKNLMCGGIGQFDLGATEYGDVLLGGKFEIPINDNLEMKTGFQMLIPSEGNARGGQEKESWNLGIEFVYRFRGGGLCKLQNPFRPLFDVADNGSFLPRVSSRR